MSAGWAGPYDCAGCGQQIGARRKHYLVNAHDVLCVDCWVSRWDLPTFAVGGRADMARAIRDGAATA